MKKTDQTLQKCDELIERLSELKKALDGLMAPSNRKLMPSLGAGWSQDAGTGALHHSLHGVINTFKNPDGSFQVKHAGGVVGNNLPNLAAAGAHIKDYVGSLGGQTVMNNIDPMAIGKDEDFEKGSYGKMKDTNGKVVSQYNAADNAKRKANNMGDEVQGIGRNKNVKAYSSKPGQLSAKQQAAKAPSGPAGPPKIFTPEQIAAENAARKFKKSLDGAIPWANHPGVPNADQELAKMQRANPVEKAENLMSNQLANLMAGRAMLGNAPRQPTDEEMFGRFVPSEEEIQKAESKWGNTMNWLEEATKPIASRFSSPEEEQAYWDSIKVNGSSKDDYGF
jgi:hypothetical protein